MSTATAGGDRSPASPPADPPAADAPGVVWLGHASAVITLGGRRVLIDPLGRARTRAAGPVDAVVITHSHVDHLNRWSLKAVDRDTLLVVPRGAGAIVADLGFREVREVGAPAAAILTEVVEGRWRKEVKERAAAALRDLDAAP